MKSKWLRKLSVILGFMGFIFCSNSFAYSSGTLECLFEIYSKKQPSKAILTPSFRLNVMEAYEDALKVDLLENRILFRYTPGLVAPGDVQVFVMDMSYNMANAGAEVPLAPNAVYTVKIGRQDSDLIGAFLVCKANNLK